MARARRLKSGAPAHEFTAEERSRGGLARAARFEEEREEQRRQAADRARALMAKALDRVEDALDGGDPRLALQAARDVLDRTLGREPIAAAPVEPIEILLSFDPDGDEVPEPVSESDRSRQQPRARRTAAKPQRAKPNPPAGREEPPAARDPEQEGLRREQAERRRRRGGSGAGGLADMSF